MGNRLLKLTVIFLCSVNAVMWELYTDSTIMALLWTAIVIAFIVWLISDIRYG